MATCVILFAVLRTPNYVEKLLEVNTDPDVWTIHQIYSYEYKADI